MSRQRWLVATTLLFGFLSLPAGPADAASLSARLPDAPATVVQDEAPPVDNQSPAQERAMLDQIRRNVDALRRAGVLAPTDSAQAVTYDLPLRLAPGLPDDAGYFVSALADHDPAAGKVLDYHGGARTYDGHKGIDFALWPFPWNKLDAGEVQVIAAAAGTIVAKADANPADHNCGSSAGGDWNYVALSHADGRMTIYGHMRYHSLTGKAIGQTVASGELLGTAASSGDSSGPHVHFEVRAASFSPVWIDPFAGPHSQAESLWTDQPPYVDSGINRLGTHAGPPSTPDPCLPTDTRFQDSFSTPANVYIYAYYRDYQGSLPTEVRVHRPDGTVFRSWSHTDETEFSRATSRAWVAQLAAGDPAGTWRVEATYNGRAHETFFNVDAPPAVAVANPNGGERWDPARAHEVTWTDNFGGEVNIVLRRDGVPVATIASNAPSDGAFQWTPGPDLPTAPGYTVVVTSVLDPAVSDESDAPFSLAPSWPPALALTKTVVDPNPEPGATTQFVLRVTNSGLGAATEARLSDILPAGIAQSGPITLDPPGAGTVGMPPTVVTIRTLDAGRSITITIPVVLAVGQPAGMTITNTADLISAEVAVPIHASAVLTVADAPLIARDDVAETVGAAAVTIPVLANDGDPNGDPLTLAAVEPPANGVAIIAGAAVRYTARPGFVGTDAFTYRVRTAREQATASVRVIVLGGVPKVWLPL
ncbi:MAG: peptidoglycan DD-metalloendopeptidase family protein, partial [Ardenticatenales bacterium]